MCLVWNLRLHGATPILQKGDIVIYGGYSYVALQFNVASKPVTDSTGNWELVFWLQLQR